MDCLLECAYEGAPPKASPLQVTTMPSHWNQSRNAHVVISEPGIHLTLFNIYIYIYATFI